MVFVMAAMVEMTLVIFMDRTSILQKRTNKISSEENKTNSKKNKRSDKIEPPKFNWNHYCKPSTDMIDFIAFWFYMVAFTIFNTIYWNDNGRM